MIKAIACIDENYGLGYKGELLFSISEDLKRFKELTLGQLCVMGRKTHQSLPNTLPHRTNIILTHNKHYSPEDKRVIVEHDANKIINHYLESGSQSKDMYIIGGQDIFKEFLPYCEEIEITRVKAKAAKCDSYFPFEFLKEFDIIHIETNWSEKYECEYDFITYKRKGGVID